MALYNEILVGELGEVLNRRLAMKAGNPAPSLAPEIMPVLGLEMDRPEWHWLGRSLLWGCGGLKTAVAGNRTVAQLRNPLGTNVIAVVERVSVETNATSPVYMDLSNVDIAGSLTQTETPRRRDGRIPELQEPACTVGMGAQVAALIPTPLHIFHAPAGQFSPAFESPVILTPGRSLLLECTIVAIILKMTIQWRERRAVAGELLD